MCPPGPFTLDNHLGGLLARCRHQPVGHNSSYAPASRSPPLFQCQFSCEWGGCACLAADPQMGEPPRPVSFREARRCPKVWGVDDVLWWLHKAHAGRCHRISCCRREWKAEEVQSPRRDLLERRLGFKSPCWGELLLMSARVASYGPEVTAVSG